MTQPPPYGTPQPAWGPPPPPPKKGMNGCAIAAIISAGILGLVILLGIIVAVFASSGSSSNDSKPRPAGSTHATIAPTTAPATTQPVEKAPVTVTAKATTFSPSVLHDGTTAYTSVKVMVTNGGKKPISINPLYFTITDTNGGKHTAELGVDDQQIATTDLAPGENITGVITGKGSWKAAYVTYKDGLFGDGVRGTVG